MSIGFGFHHFQVETFEDFVQEHISVNIYY